MERKRVKYPLGTQDFEKLRDNGEVYVDKTDIIYDLVRDNNYVFFARPRRFGKSLLLSTLRYYFEGKKELFEGLKIYDLEKEWRKHPVIHLELSGINPDEEISLEERFIIQFKVWEKKYGIDNVAQTLSARFHEIIVNAYHSTGERVVVLIDEYDNPSETRNIDDWKIE